MPCLASEYGVKRIGLFGSYARDASTEKSDIDLVVEFSHPIGFRFVEFADYLEGLAVRRIHAYCRQPEALTYDLFRADIRTQDAAIRNKEQEG